ncbi:MAG: hypothetical protein RL033_4765 [Pseudomonadota bacterium]
MDLQGRQRDAGAAGSRVPRVSPVLPSSETTRGGCVESSHTEHTKPSGPKQA